MNPPPTRNRSPPGTWLGGTKSRVGCSRWRKSRWARPEMLPLLPCAASSMPAPPGSASKSDGGRYTVNNNPVFIALQATDTARAIVAAIVADNPLATVAEYPAMVKIDAPGRLVIRRLSVEERLGRRWDLQE